MKKTALFLCVLLIVPNVMFAQHDENYTEKIPKLGESLEKNSMMFRQVCDTLNMMNKTGISNQEMFRRDFEDNPVLMALISMNESLTIKVDYNNTECVKFHLIVENSTLKSIEFGEMNASGIYIRVDIAFLEEIRMKLVDFDAKSNSEKFFAVLWVAKKFIGSFFNGSFVIKPFKVVFKFFDVLIEVAKNM